MDPTASSPLAIGLAVVAIAVTLLILRIFGPVFFTGGKFPTVPGGSFVLGHAGLFAELHRFADVLDEWCSEHGVVEYRVLNQRYLLVADYDEMQKILKQRPGKVQRFRLITELFGYMIPSVFSLEQPSWAAERRVVTHAFSRSYTGSYVPAIRRTTAQLRELLAVDGGNGAKAVAIDQVLQLFAADAIALMGLGVDGDALRKRSAEGVLVTKASKVLAQRVLSPAQYWRIPFLGQRLDGGRKERAQLHAHTARLVGEARLKPAEARGTILDNFIAKADADGGAVSDERLGGNAASLFVAGTDTVASTTSWMLYDLGRDSQLQAEARAEAAKASLSDASSFTDILVKLPILRSLFQEELRVRAPLTFQLLENRTEPLEIAGRTCAPGEYALVWPMRWFATRPEAATEVGPDPGAFVARRWVTDDGQACTPLPPMVAPFGHGARLCPGKDVAAVEALLVVSEILLSFNVEMRETEAIEHHFGFAMHPSRPMQLHFTARLDQEA